MIGMSTALRERPTTFHYHGRSTTYKGFHCYCPTGKKDEFNSLIIPERNFAGGDSRLTWTAPSSYPLLRYQMPHRGRRDKQSKSEDTSIAPHQLSTIVGDASTTSGVTSGVPQDDTSAPPSSDAAADHQADTRASSVPSTEGTWTQKIRETSSSPPKHNGTTGTKQDEKARTNNGAEKNNALQAGTSGRSPVLQVQSGHDKTTKITATFVTNNRTSATDSPGSSESRTDNGNGGSVVVGTAGEAVTNGPTDSDNGPPPPVNRNVRGTSERRCCMCWCCCCSCSCMPAPPKPRGHGSDRDNNNRTSQQLASFDHVFNGDNDAPPSLEEIRTWGESFDRLMKCPAGRKLFRDFLRCEYSEENILFWLACEELKKEVNPTVIEEKARLIYEDYISILSPKEVSLDSRVREIINRNMVAPTPHTFDEAQLQIYTLMHRDSYPRFVNSPMYRSLAQLPAPNQGGSAA